MICGTAAFVCLVCGGAESDCTITTPNTRSQRLRTHTHRGTTERPRHTSRRSQDVIHFLKTCGEENLQFLLVPARLKKSLDYLDTDGSGELDVDEWEAAINRGLAKRLEQMADERARAARAAEKADAEFSADFLNAAREVFIMSARGVRPSTSNLRASRSARTPSTRLVAHRPAPAQDRQGRLRVARSRGNCEVRPR